MHKVLICMSDSHHSKDYRQEYDENGGAIACKPGLYNGPNQECIMTEKPPANIRFQIINTITLPHCA